jgi:hypothetical protein
MNSDEHDLGNKREEQPQGGERECDAVDGPMSLRLRNAMGPTKVGEPDGSKVSGGEPSYNNRPTRTAIASSMKVVHNGDYSDG